MTTAGRRYAGYRFPAEIISHAVWLYFRFPLGLRMVEEMLTARGIIVSHETVRQWARKFGQEFANQIRRRMSCAGDKWHLDEVVLKIAGATHWLWQAVDQTGIVCWRGGLISRADVADFLIKNVEDRVYVGKTPVLAY